MNNLKYYYFCIVLYSCKYFVTMEIGPGTYKNRPGVITCSTKNQYF